jgi:hypothetical protein
MKEYILLFLLGVVLGIGLPTLILGRLLVHPITSAIKEFNLSEENGPSPLNIALGLIFRKTPCSLIIPATIECKKKNPEITIKDVETVYMLNRQHITSINRLITIVNTHAGQKI